MSVLGGLIQDFLTWLGRQSCTGGARQPSQGQPQPSVLQQPSCPAAPHPCSLFPLPAHRLLLMPFLALWGRDCLSPFETHTVMAPNVTAPKRPVRAVLTQTSVSLLPEAPSGPEKRRLVDPVLTRKSSAMVLHPGSSDRLYICKASLPPRKNVTQLLLLCSPLVRALEESVIPTATLYRCLMRHGRKQG